jgi:hypothetical protein
MRRLAALASLFLVAAIAAPASAAPFAPSVPLPTDFQPEGIAVGTGSTFYVGSMWDGDIYRGSLRSGTGSVFIDVTGRQALGMKVDEGRHLLFVAGGFNGHAYVYDTRTGATVADLSLGTPPATVVNDVALTRRAAYFTDSFAPVIYKVPIGAHGAIGAPETIDVTGPAAVSNPGGFGLNGIVAKQRGSVLLVDHSDLGILATIDPTTGASSELSISGGSLIAGTVDGLVVAGHTAWVVENFANAVAQVRLSPDLTTGRLVRTITDPGFEVPTAGAFHGSRLALVNAKFDLGFPPPIGPGAPPGTEFDVSLLRVR